MDDNKNTSSQLYISNPFFITNKNLVRCALITATIFTFACDKKKTTESVFPENNKTETKICGGDSSSGSKLIRNEYIVRWENGDISVETADNTDQFVNQFVQPQLQNIQHVEFNKRIYKTNSNYSHSSKSTDLYTSFDNSDPFNQNGDPNNTGDSGQIDNQGPSQIHAPAVWNQGFMGEGAVVAVVDTPVDISHPQLKNRIYINEAEANGKPGVDDDGNGFIDDVYGWNFNEDRPQSTADVSDHGTHVAGIIAADDTRKEISGIAPKAKIVAASFLDPSGNGNLFSALTALKYASARGAQIINASWGAECYSPSLETEIKNLAHDGVLFVAAAGNEFLDFDTAPKNTWTYPAAYNLENQITVGANNLLGYLLSFSNRSFSLVHLTAPGYKVLSSVPGGYAQESGTSMAAPFVTGAAALLKGAFPNANPVLLKQAILAGVTKHQGYISKTLTGGILDIEASMNYLKNHNQ